MKIGKNSWWFSSLLLVLKLIAMVTSQPFMDRTTITSQQALDGEQNFYIDFTNYFFLHVTVLCCSRSKQLVLNTRLQWWKGGEGTWSLRLEARTEETVLGMPRTTNPALFFNNVHTGGGRGGRGLVGQTHIPNKICKFVKAFGKHWPKNTL